MQRAGTFSIWGKTHGSKPNSFSSSQAHSFSCSVLCFFLGLLRSFATYWTCSQCSAWLLSPGFSLGYPVCICSVSYTEQIDMVSIWTPHSCHWFTQEFRGKVTFVLFVQPLFRKVLCIVAAVFDAFFIHPITDGISFILIVGLCACCGGFMWPVIGCALSVALYKSIVTVESFNIIIQSMHFFTSFSQFSSLLYDLTIRYMIQSW